MAISGEQRHRVDAIGSLLTQADRDAIGQGVELAAALGDPGVFDALLDGTQVSPPITDPVDTRRRFPTITPPAALLERGESRGLVDLATAHLIAASDHPLRSQVTSLSLGYDRGRHRTNKVPLWVDGLERLPALTHLDLALSPRDQGLDLRSLEHLGGLTHLRLRGSQTPGPLPGMERLEVLDATKIALAPGATYPRLRSITANFAHSDTSDPLTPEVAPNLVTLKSLGSLRLAGYESFDTLRCTRGRIVVLDCQHIEFLKLTASWFHAPDLRAVGTLERACPGLDVSQLDTLDDVRFNPKARFTGGTFPTGSRFIDPKVVLAGDVLTDLGNLGELPGLERLILNQAADPISLDTLRHATELRMLDIRRSPGITDLTPLVALPNLEMVVINDPERFDIPPELTDRVKKVMPRSPMQAAAVKKTPQDSP